MVINTNSIVFQNGDSVIKLNSSKNGFEEYYVKGNENIKLALKAKYIEMYFQSTEEGLLSTQGFTVPMNKLNEDENGCMWIGALPNILVTQWDN